MPRIREGKGSEVAQSCPTLCDPMDWVGPTRLLSPWDFPGKSIGVGCHFLLQGIFLTQGSNPGLRHCRQMLYPLSHQGSHQEESENHPANSNTTQEGLPISWWSASVQFSHSVMSDSLRLHGLQHRQSLSITNSWSLLKLVSMELVMPSNHLILY